MIQPLLRREMGRIGGVGLKIHPDFSYANLYYWLLGDGHFLKRGQLYDLPYGGCPYCEDAGEAAHDLAGGGPFAPTSG